MSELSFLLNLLLEHKLQKATKEFIIQRIKEVELILSANAPVRLSSPPVTAPKMLNGVPQAPSMIKLMEKYPDLVISTVTPATAQPAEEPPPVEVIAQTPQTMAALQSRQEALSGKIDKATGRPRKW